MRIHVVFWMPWMTFYQHRMIMKDQTRKKIQRRFKRLLSAFQSQKCMRTHCFGIWGIEIKCKRSGNLRKRVVGSHVACDCLPSGCRLCCGVRDCTCKNFQPMRPVWSGTFGVPILSNSQNYITALNVRGDNCCNRLQLLFSSTTHYLVPITDHQLSITYHSFN